VSARGRTPACFVRIARCVLIAGAALTARPAAAQRLFRTDSVLPVTITTNLGALLKDRDSLELKKHDAVFSYSGDDGKLVSMPVQLRARGHFRRQARNCDYPPLWLDVKNSVAKGTLLAGEKKIKIATACKPRLAEYEQYMLKEYLTYRAYATLTDASYRTRLLRITYRDTLGKVPTVTTSGFFLENVDDLAARLQRKEIKQKGARFADVDPQALAMLSMFEYFIGNTDWSIAGLHNMTLLEDSTGIVLPVAYDFDWTGAVDPRYAFPDKSLPIHRVSERLWRGNCLSDTDFKATVARFRAKHAAIDALFGEVPQLAPDQAKSMKAFFDDFWKRTDDPRGLQKEIASDCLKGGN
jgi:hypothetical protein